MSYPGRVFADSPEGRASKKYVERFLDATKSNMLFAKGIIFVEGIAEQLLIPCFAEYIGAQVEEKHVAVIAVGGSTFKHFLPIFGATSSQDKRRYALDRPVSCLLDGDPMLKRKDDNRRTKCWPYQIDSSCGAAACYGFSSLFDQTQYFPISLTVKNLERTCYGCPNISVFYGTKTLEYDLAAVNACSTVLIAAAPDNFRETLLDFANDPGLQHNELDALLDNDTTSALALLAGDSEAKKGAAFATYYLTCVEDSKGEHAFDLAHNLKLNLTKQGAERHSLKIPPHIEKAILWAGRVERTGASS